MTVCLQKMALDMSSAGVFRCRIADASKLGCLLDQLAKPTSIGQHECTSAALDEAPSLERLELARYRFTTDANTRRDLCVRGWRRDHGLPWSSRFGSR
jgi:hypothetical protein